MPTNQANSRGRPQTALLLVGALALWGATGSLRAAVTPEQIEFFESKVRPVLAEHCYSCHSGSIETPFAGLRLDSREAILKGGDSGPAIRAGQPAQSRIVKALRGEPVLMPPGGRLPSEHVANLAEWIRMGAPWPEQRESADSRPKGFDLEARRREHWAWQPVKTVEPPAVKKRQWPTNPVDQFILSRLEAEGLRPAPPADRRTLIRRLAFDLTGLPPSPEETDRFVRDDSPDAYEKLVRRLLDSDHFGERWARHWMDLVRYADSHGSEGDPAIPAAWQYRDYLIRSLNADTPYDQLIREHLAGDLLATPRTTPERNINESILGTAHFRLVELGYQPVDPWEERVKWTDNQIDVFSKAFQGLTVACARCHDHKFDAISQEDYYALFGVFYGARPTMRAVDAPEALRLHSQSLRDLKGRIRDKVAAAWIDAAETLGERLQQAQDAALKAALEEAACDEGSPLAAWLDLRGLGGAQLRGAWQRLREDWRGELDARVAYNQQHFERIWDLAGADYEEWTTHGNGTNEGPSAPGEFQVALDGERVLEGIYPAGAYTHLLSSKHAGVMQSPRFEIESDYISVRVLGGGLSFARLIVENYSVPLGGIYGQRHSPRSDTMRWWRFKTEFWKGFTGYIEFATREDATNFVLDSVDSAKNPRPERPTHGRSSIGASAVAFHNGKHEPRSIVEPILHLLEAEPPEASKDLADVIGSRLAEAAAAWREGRVGEQQAAYLDYFVRRGLLPTLTEQVAGVGELVEAYRRIEGLVPVPQRFPGVVDEHAPDQPLLVRGDPKQPAAPVTRRFLAALGRRQVHRSSRGAPSAGRRCRQSRQSAHSQGHDKPRLAATFRAWHRSDPGQLRSARQATLAS